MTALPEYYVNERILFEDFSDITDFSNVAWSTAGTKTADAVYTKVGASSMRIQTAVGARAMLQKTIDKVFTNNELYIRVYIPDNTNLDYIEISLTTEANSSDVNNYNKRFAMTWYYRVLQTGWNIIPIVSSVVWSPPIAWTKKGTIDWASAMKTITVVVNPKEASSTTVVFDSIYCDIKKDPLALITFDDGYDSLYTLAYPLFKARGLKSTFYVSSSLVGGAGRLTAAQLIEMYADGISIGNHSSTHDTLVGLSYATVSSRLQTCIDYLLSLGLERAAYHVAAPGGATDANVLQVMADLGMKTHRNASSSTGGLWNAVGLPENAITALSLGPSTSLAVAKAAIDNAITNGLVVSLYGHIIADSGTTAWSAANLTALLDYIVERGIKTVTIDEYHEGKINPRYNSVSLARATS
ncbi:MAG: polysaccharide deacetylase family protein [Syntrophomonas sp.]|nr:polysaccharide deacetylase family protein [Syntrophomonas sp.]